MSVLQRFYETSAGEITIDGIDIKRWNTSWLRAQIEWCSKSQCCLIGALIAANIRYGASFREVGDEEVVEAARGANIHDFITSLPEVGWGVCVGGGGEGGVAL